MVNIGNGDDTDQAGDQVQPSSSHSVKCPVCLENVVIAKKDNYFLPSNFHKHIRVHIRADTKTKSKRKLRSSKVTQVKRTSRRGRLENANDTSVDTSSDSDDDADITKEMQENFAKESDSLEETFSEPDNGNV